MSARARVCVCRRYTYKLRVSAKSFGGITPTFDNGYTIRNMCVCPRRVYTNSVIRMQACMTDVYIHDNHVHALNLHRIAPNHQIARSVSGFWSMSRPSSGVCIATAQARRKHGSTATSYDEPPTRALSHQNDEPTNQPNCLNVSCKKLHEFVCRCYS